MAIGKEVDFVSGVTPVSEAFMDLWQEMLASYVSPNFLVEAASTTTVRVPAGNNHDSVGIAIGGEFRRRDTLVAGTVSGGAGTKIIYATADSGDNLFALEVTGGAPAATKFRKVGEVDWSGTVIEEVRSEFPLVPAAPGEFPIGGGCLWFHATAPANHLLLDGAAHSRTVYADLFALWGVLYGPGNGSTTFNVPDLRQYIPMGKAASGTGSVLGEKFGAIDHAHTGPSHTHTGPSHTHTGGSHEHTNPGTSFQGDHAHSTPDHGHSGTTGGSTLEHFANVGGGASFGYTPVSHAHGFSTGGGGGSSGGAGGHSHSQGNTGSGGLVASAASGTAATGAGGTANTGVANPPIMVVNYIVRAL